VEHEDVTIWGCHRFSSPVEGKSPKQALAHALSCLAEQHAPADV
jgi:hypothetical protein